MRCFTAIDIPQNVRQVLADRQAQLRSRVEAKRWQSLEHAHLTVQFFGEIRESLLPSLCSALEGGARSIVPFHLQLGGLGNFAARRKPRVLFCEVEGDRAALLKLESVLQEACRPWGLGEEVPILRTSRWPAT